jgi:hypothetical protein
MRPLATVWATLPLAAALAPKPDLHSFARSVDLPGLEDVNVPKSPWIVYGGSLAGTLSAFTMKTYGDTYYGNRKQRSYSRPG